MKRIQKKMLLEMMETLESAVAKVNKSIKDGGVNAALSLLSACQESAVTIGTSMEELAGEGTQTVHNLEEFCEEVYRVSVLVGDENPETLKSAQPNKLSEILKNAKASWMDEIKVKSTVVFLPVDAEWWDGFQTVWEKEISDENTTVYVIPIPWYASIPGVKEVESHYNIEAYPKDINPIDFTSIILSEIKPDVIYIQDARDGDGSGRNVPADYHTGVLKELTDDLTYIPYEILPEPNLKDRRQDEKTAALVLVKGLLNTTTVIVQSPNMRNAYIRAMCTAYGNEDRDVYETMIKGTGSPRAELIGRLKAEDFVIPESWNEFVYREDGSRKKIILYCNSTFLFMENGHGLVEKIRNSMKVFEENRDDVALLWRPNPMTREVLISMRPEYVKEYDDFVSEFKEKRYGILDEDEDYTRSIVLSDAYYGDDGMMVTLYKATGKPIMIENLEIMA